VDDVFLPFVVFEDKNLQKEWKNLIKEWLEYKKDIKDSYKSSKSIKAFHDKLFKLSGGELSIAREIVENSIANGYKGIFEIRKNNYPPNNKDPNSRSEQIKKTMMNAFPEVFDEIKNEAENKSKMKTVNPVDGYTSDDSTADDFTLDGFTSDDCDTDDFNPNNYISNNFINNQKTKNA
jgi:hypothetical protein